MILVANPAPATLGGWLAIVMIAVLAVACFFLFRSMRKQMRKIDFPEDGVPTRSTAHAPDLRAPKDEPRDPAARRDGGEKAGNELRG